MHLVGTGPYVVASSDFAAADVGWIPSSIHGLNDILPTAISGTATFHDPGNNYPDETWDFATDLWTNLQTLSYDAATTTWTERVSGPNWYLCHPYFDIALSGEALAKMTLADHTHPNDYATAVDNAIAQLYAVPDDNGDVLLDLTPDIGPLPANMDLPPVSWTATDTNGVTFASGTVPAGGPTTLTLPNCPAAFTVSIRVALAHCVGDNTPIVLTANVTVAGGEDPLVQPLCRAKRPSRQPCQEQHAGGVCSG